MPGSGEEGGREGAREKRGRLTDAQEVYFPANFYLFVESVTRGHWSGCCSSLVLPGKAEDSTFQSKEEVPWTISQKRSQDAGLHPASGRVRKGLLARGLVVAFRLGRSHWAQPQGQPL